MKLLLITLVYAAVLGGFRISVCGKSTNDWKSRIVYQILTDRFAKTGNSTSPCSDLSDYCGGTFRGIIDKLDYIQDLGANAIWISPIPEQTPKGYHGYWQKNLYKINPHFGTATDLKELIAECHRRDIWVMLDVVANHMGYLQKANDFSIFTPFNKPEYFHFDCSITKPNDQRDVEYCRLAGLPDLDQSNAYVRSKLKEWVHDVVKTYGFDSIRIDTVPYVSKDFWTEYTRAAGVSYSIGEVFNGNAQFVAGYQSTMSALFNYPLYYKLLDAYKYKKSMYKIREAVIQNAVFSNAGILGLFVDNHDNNRFLSGNTDVILLKNALTYILFAEGIPFIYYGTEQGYSGGHDPKNREVLWPNYNTTSDLYKFISTLAKLRTKMGRALYEGEQVERYVDDNFFAFTRGSKGEVFVATSNIGRGQKLMRTITHHPYSDYTGTNYHYC